MADPPVVPDPTTTAESTAALDSNAQSLHNVGEMASMAKGEMSALDSVVNGVKDKFVGFSSTLKQYGIALNQTHALNVQQTTQFGLLATAVFGSQKAFEGLAGVDTKSLSTFGDQINYITANLGSGKGALSSLVKLAEQGFGAVVPDAAKKSVSAMKGFLGNLVESADNSLKLQNAVIQLAAKTGNLNDVYSKAGPTLGKMNSLLAQQNAMMDKAQTATGLSRDTIDHYYASLGAIPGALAATVAGTGNTSSSMNMLTATIKLATGTGRAFDDVTKDLHQSFKEFNLVGQDALTFTARFTELSGKLGVEFDDMRAGLMGAASAFKNITDRGKEAYNMTEGLSNIMNKYVDSLKASGMTGAHAVETVKGMTDAMANMTIAQKSFLSAQTGGAGGLMGGFQIEKMMRDGNIEGVQDKIMQTMKKQFGKITTLDEAGKSEQGAAQLQKQIMLLKQGPLGGMVKTDQDAYKLLEAMRAKDEGRAPSKDLSSTVLQDSIAKGTSIEEKSYTQFTAMREHLDAIRRVAETSNLGFVQQATAASAGGGEIGTQTANQRETRAGLKGTMSQAATEGGKEIQEQNAAGTRLMDKSGKVAAAAITDFQKWFSTVPKSLSASMDTIRQTVSTGKKEDIPAAIAQARKDIDAKREALKAQSANMSKSDLAKQTAQLNAEDKLLGNATKKLEQTGFIPDPKITAGKSKAAPGDVNMAMDETNFGSTTLGEAAAKNTATPPDKGGAKTTAPSAAAIPSGNQRVDVHVTGMCINCGKTMDQNDQQKATSAASGSQ